MKHSSLAPEEVATSEVQVALLRSSPGGQGDQEEGGAPTPSTGFTWKHFLSHLNINPHFEFMETKLKTYFFFHIKNSLK